ncbi:TrbI/VirB10 family protein [Luteimonas aestuarii]|uniref:TrbI/VirB10 family protein n=1 Tax=Luteimonas aestuarii TaxID=453837 RepID=A0A4R5TJX9_9GAMM|nr:TrbI/VirB10 family protein [Luteimonas aestuarii]TDK22668.1 TrbI/VirB10 family protein [Luteimonas aestuarii]
MNQPPTLEHEEPGFNRNQSSNPYVGRQAPADPDLDAEAPYLKSEDVQRLNRKALLFLGGIVLLLGMVALWIFSGGLSGSGDGSPVPPRSEQVVIPAAPRDIPELPPERTLPPPVADLPPLPVYDMPQQHTPPAMSLSSGGEFGGRRELSLQERRMLDTAGTFAGFDHNGPGGGVSGMLPPDEYARLMMSAGQESPAPAPQEAPEGTASARPLYNPNTLLLRGTYIRCVMQSRVISDFPGYTTCIVTEPVYSVNGRRLLLPRGSKVSGTYGQDAIIGDRVAIVWDRITTPNGMDVNMRSPGVDMLGAAGNAGHYTAHWGQRIGSALLISLLSDSFKYAGAKHGPQETSIANGVIVQSPYESNTARTMERLANMALDRNMTRPPTVTINQGSVVNVYVARDVDFSAVLR